MEHEFKIGNKVRCKPGFNNDGIPRDDNYGGEGYEENYEFIISNISNNAAWSKERDRDGIYIKALELVNDNILSLSEMVEGEYYYGEGRNEKFIYIYRDSRKNLTSSFQSIYLVVEDYFKGDGLVRRNQEITLLRKATLEEKQHLDDCIEADEFVKRITLPQIDKVRRFKCIDQGNYTKYGMLGKFIL